MSAPGSFFTTHREKNKLFNFLVIRLSGPGVIGGSPSPTTNDCSERVRGGGDPRPTHPPARRHRRTPSPSLPRIICLCVHQITPSPHPRGQPGPLHPSQYDMQALRSATRRQSKGREGRAGEEEGREKHAALNYLLTPGQRLPFTH